MLVYFVLMMYNGAVVAVVFFTYIHWYTLIIFSDGYVPLKTFRSGPSSKLLLIVYYFFPNNRFLEFPISWGSVRIKIYKNKSLETLQIIYYLKKNQNAPRPSEHPPVRGKKCQNV